MAKMACKGLGCCGGFLNFLIGYWNFSWLILGSGIVVATMVIAYANVDILVNNKFVIHDLLNWSRGTTDLITYVFIGAGVILMIMGLIGLIGACRTNRCFLVLFEIFAITIFLAHTAAFTYVALNLGDVNESTKNSLSLAINDINNQTFNFEAKCQGLFRFSKALGCCGLQTPFEIVSESLRETCCDLSKNTNSRGCSRSIDNFFQETTIYAFIIPNAMLLAVEVFYILATPFLIKKIANKSQVAESQE